MTPRDFVTAYLPAAVENERRSGVPWQVTLAQAALESGWGKHAPGFNFFGIKAGGAWTGKVQRLLTDEFLGGRWVKVEQPFRAYDSAAASFADHAALLRRVKLYADAFETKDPREFARRIAGEFDKNGKLIRTRYATDPNYAAKVIAIIDQLEKIAADEPPPSVLVEVPKPAPSLWARIKGWFA